MNGPSQQSPPPRLYGILATAAPVVLIFRRGPTDWFHLMRWWVDEARVEPGVWVRKRVFARHCDLSSDGELLLFLLSGTVKGQFQVIGGISRAPWLHPLASWDEHSTVSRGWCFATHGIAHTWDKPRDVTLSTGRIVIQRNDNVSFVNELRRGWVEAPDCPPRHPQDVWDENRSIVLQREWKASGDTLRLIGGRHDSEGGMDGKAPTYEVQFRSGNCTPLVEAAWADWDHRGRLLVATHHGQLRVKEVGESSLITLEEHDLSAQIPNPQPPPEGATVAPPLASVELMHPRSP